MLPQSLHSFLIWSWDLIQMVIKHQVRPEGCPLVFCPNFVSAVSVAAAAERKQSFPGTTVSPSSSHARHAAESSAAQLRVQTPGMITSCVEVKQGNTKALQVTGDCRDSSAQSFLIEHKAGISGYKRCKVKLLSACVAINPTYTTHCVQWQECDVVTACVHSSLVKDLLRVVLL